MRFTFTNEKLRDTRLIIAKWSFNSSQRFSPPWTLWEIGKLSRENMPNWIKKKEKNSLKISKLDLKIVELNFSCKFRVANGKWKCIFMLVCKWMETKAAKNSSETLNWMKLYLCKWQTNGFVKGRRSCCSNFLIISATDILCNHLRLTNASASEWTSFEVVVQP